MLLTAPQGPIIRAALKKRAKTIRTATQKPRLPNAPELVSRVNLKKLLRRGYAALNRLKGGEGRLRSGLFLLLRRAAQPNDRVDNDLGLRPLHFDRPFSCLDASFVLAVRHLALDQQVIALLNHFRRFDRSVVNDAVVPLRTVFHSDKVLKAFGVHIFFDDQDVHCAPASRVVPTARVFSRTPTPLPPQRELPLVAAKSESLLAG